MAVNENCKNFILDQLSNFGGVEAKKMFGGIGLFKEAKMFGMIGGDVFRLKVDMHNQGDSEAHGMKLFESKSKKKGMPYWEVPIQVIEDKDKLTVWAQKSYNAALRK